jgi:preprotein translocase subunit SecY
VQYAKRMVGRRMYGGSSTYIPIKINMSGVIPIIFASSLLAVPGLIAQFGNAASGWVQWISRYLAQQSSPVHIVLYTLLIIFFCYFYTAITFNPDEVADNMKKYGGFIPGIRPGKNTADYMNKILTKITVVGGLYLSILSIIPQIMIAGIRLQTLPVVGNFIDNYFPRWLLDGLGVHFYFGGTSLLIVVGVAMDTINQVEAQLIMRHYEGFTPRSGRIRGRRSTF